MSKGTSNFASTAGRQLGNLGGSLLKVGTIAGGAALAGVTALGAGLAGFAVSGISQAKDLDQQMANIAAVMGKTKDEVGPLKDLILELSINPNLKVSATEAADAVELLARNGVDATDIIDGMAESTVALANATGADFALAADLATDVMALFSGQGVTMQQAIDGITGVTVNSKFSVNDYADAMANMGGAASGLGLDFRQVNALLAETAFSFKGGDEAGTALRNIFLRLSNPTGEMAAEMESLGLSLFNTDGSMKDIGEVATDLGNILQGQATITQTVGGVTTEMANAAESASKKLPALNNTIEEQQANLAILQNELGAVTDMYGEGSPAVEKHKVKILTLSNSLGENIAKQQEMQKAISAVENAETKVIETTRELTQQEKARLEGLLGGTRGVNALVAISKVQGEEFDELTDKINAEGQAMQAALTRVDSLQGAMEILNSIIESVKIQVGDLFLPVLKDLVGNFADLASKQGPNVIAFFGRIADFLSGTVIPSVTNFITTIKGLATTFQAGGLFGSRSGSFGSEGLLSALGIPPDAIQIIQDVFEKIRVAIFAFQTSVTFGGGVVGGAGS
jgi:TP901 family phage tail tape measure protein